MIGPLTLQQWIAALLMIAAVLRIAWIDLKIMRIPDHWNVLLAGLGIAYRLPFGDLDTLRALAVGLATMAAFALLRWVHRRISGRIGLGLGDVKFIGSAAVWFSPWNLPLFFMLASSTALLFSLIFLRGKSTALRNLRVPFGPFLGIALVLTWLSEVTSLFSLIPARSL
ncbi:prepilin peptidase [Agrobacterium rhizogenes]|uniref:prepilin peptidase n=1 Tax=Rhizobium rhizogenes TaxID=359 RepID=UPI0015746C1A|nr:A24 family peptidase [Rhizobium rhizogenes]NTG48081.1 prepilin peptidase [Rhizobium rhizogenes]